MSQSRPGESDHHGDLDPLLAFNAELAAVESPHKPVDPTPPAAAPKADDALPLRLRLDQAERSLERARIEISALKSDLATLVTAVDDIKKRMSRRPDVNAAPQPVRVPPRRGPLKTAAVLIVCLTIGAAMWSLASGTMLDDPFDSAPGKPFDSARESARVAQDKPFDSTRESASVAQGKPLEPASSPALLIPVPAAAVPTPAVELQTVADVPATPSFDSARESARVAQDKPFDSARESARVAQDKPFDSARESARVAQDKPVREPVEREPPRQGVYVGTLSIEAVPEGEVFINRQLAGRTPLRAENLRAGSHLIWIEREGYRRWTRVVAVTADRVTRVSAELAPLSR